MKRSNQFVPRTIGANFRVWSAIEDTSFNITLSKEGKEDANGPKEIRWNGDKRPST